MIKKLSLFSILLSCLSLNIAAEEFFISDLSAGMYSNASANSIPDNAASLIQNFVTDVEPLSVERNGFVKRDSTVLGGTAPVSGLWSFTDPTGLDWIISFSSRTFYKNTIGGTPTAFGLSATVDTVPDAAINLGKIWFVNGANSLWWFDGTSTGVVASAPTGRLIEPWRNRLVIGYITGAQSTLRFSEDGDGTIWTIGGNPTEPFSVQIGGANDGQNIRCLKGSYLDSLIIGRKYDLWAIDGFDQADVSLRNISAQVGCLESNTMHEVDNSLIFLSARGIEEMKGRSLRLVSEPIRDVTDVIIKNSINQRSNTQTSGTDFSAGDQDPDRFFSTASFPGNLRPPFPDTFSTFRDGLGGSPIVWGEYDGGSATGDVSANGTLNIQSDGSSLGDIHAYTVNTVLNWSAGTTFYFQISTITHSGPSLSPDRFFMAFSTRIISGTDIASYATFYLQLNVSTTSEPGFRGASVFTASGSSSTPSDFSLTLPATFQVYLDTSSYRVSYNQSVILSSGHVISSNLSAGFHALLSYQKSTAGSGTAAVDNFRTQHPYATFTSQLLNIGSEITAWGPVTISDVQTDGTLTYQFGSTNTASVSAITNWQSISNGQIPTVSTNPYAAFRVTLANPTALTDNNVYLSEFVTTWSEGAQPPSPVSWVYDNRYWISYTTSTASDPYQDSIFVFQRNKSWVIFKGLYAASFATWRDSLYFGNSNSTGYVYKFDVGNNDDGADIASIITTKSYNLGQLFREKEFIRLYANYLGGDGFSGNFSLSYNLDRYGTQYSLGTVNMSESNGLASMKFPFSLSNLVRGREIQYTLQKTGTGDRLRLYGLSTQFQLKQER